MIHPFAMNIVEIELGMSYNWREREDELNREMKMALLLLSEQRNESTPMVVASKKEMNDTVI